MKKTLSLIIIATLAATGCTENQRARTFGGTANTQLPSGVKLVTATWKDDDLWLLTRIMRADEKPETYALTEQSSFGVIQGKVIIVESK